MNDTPRQWLNDWWHALDVMRQEGYLTTEQAENAKQEIARLAVALA